MNLNWIALVSSDSFERFLRRKPIFSHLFIGRQKGESLKAVKNEEMCTLQ